MTILLFIVCFLIVHCDNPSLSLCIGGASSVPFRWKWKGMENSFGMDCIIWNNLLSAFEWTHRKRCDLMMIMLCDCISIHFSLKSRCTHICSMKFSGMCVCVCVRLYIENGYGYTQCTVHSEQEHDVFFLYFSVSFSLFLCKLCVYLNCFWTNSSKIWTVDGVTIWFSVLLFVSILKSIRIIRVRSLKPLLGLFEIK